MIELFHIFKPIAVASLFCILLNLNAIYKRKVCNLML